MSTEAIHMLVTLLHDGVMRRQRYCVTCKSVGAPHNGVDAAAQDQEGSMARALRDTASRAARWASRSSRSRTASASRAARRWLLCAASRRAAASRCAPSSRTHLLMVIFQSPLPVCAVLAVSDDRLC